MTQSTILNPLEGRQVHLMVGNTPVSAEVREVSGLALKLTVRDAVPPVPRVRVELVDVDPPLNSLQLQGMVTQRSAGEVTVTLERLMVAAGEELVDTILAAWFVAVPRRADCYQPMMRGYGYELRKAILSGRVTTPAPPVERAPRPEPPPVERAPRPEPPPVERAPRPKHDPSKDTLDGFPPAAVRAGMLDANMTIPKAAVPAPPPVASTPPAPAFKPPPPPRRGLPPQVSRTGERLVVDTRAIQMSVDCSAEGAGYGRGVVYRIAAGGRLVFVAARGVRPNFGARVELITDLVQSGLSATIRIAASVSWQAPDPDYPHVTLMALRLAPTNQPSHLHSWDTCCTLAFQQNPQASGPRTLVPSRAVISVLDN